MATTIDSLQIEIQSNSTNAADGIRNLAKSLGELKNNGTINVAIKNLNNLSGALRGFTDAANVTRSLGKLVGSLGRLKEVGSVTSIANGLTKLTASMKGVETINIDRVAPQVERLAKALEPLSAVKAGGINTIANGLIKMGKINLDAVTANLDDESIGKFADKVKQLTDALDPLSTQMKTVKTGLDSINKSARSAASGTQKLGDDVNATTLNISSMIHVIQTAVHAIQGVVQAIIKTTSAAIEWDGIASRFGRGFGSEAEYVYDWIQKLNDEMGINVQQFMQYSSVYATMLTGFGVEMEDASKMALGYTELTYDIWAGYNDIYAGFADAADAVKSAIAGEVEPIRRAGFTIVESTLEQTAANYGLEVSLHNATEAQKSYLRYLSLVDQAHAQGLVGTYAKELNTAEGLMRTFSQQLKSLVQAFGSLFLPVLVKVMPYLQAFVELLTEGVQALAALFGITIQGVDWSGYEDGIGGVTDSTDDLTGSLDSATQAAKELKNATLGIDELNVISPPSASAGAGAGGAGGDSGWGDLDVESMWDESIFADINSQVDAIKEKLEGWLPVIGAIAAAIGTWGVASLIGSMETALVKFAEADGWVNNLKHKLAGLAIITIEAFLVFMLSDEYLETGNFMALVGEALATAAGGYLMYKGFGTKGLVVSLIVSMLAQLASITMNLADGGVEIDDPELWIQTAMTALTGAAGGMFAFKGIEKIGAGKGAVIGMAASLSLSLAAVTIGDVASDGELGVDNVITGLLSVVGGAATGAMVGGLWGAVIGAAAMLVVNVVGAIVGAVNAEAKESLEEDLQKRFGDITLTTRQIKVVVDEILPEWSDDMIRTDNLWEGIDKVADQLEKQLNDSRSIVWKMSVGFDLTDEDNDDYKKAINSFIQTCQSYVEDRGFALSFGLEITGANQSIIDSANEISSLASAEMKRLGEKLQKTVTDAYADGLLDVDEAKVIENIQNDMLTIQNALATGKILGSLDTIGLKLSASGLTQEDYEELMTDLNLILKNEVKPALENVVNENLGSLKGNVAFAELMYNKAETAEERTKWKKVLKDAEAALQEYIDQNPLENLTVEASFKAVTIGLNTIKDLFEEEITKAEKNGSLKFEWHLEDAIRVNPGVVFEENGKDVYGNVDAVMVEIYSRLKLAKYDLSEAARDNLEAMLDNLSPTMEDYKKIATDNRKTGTTLIQSVRDGLNDYNELRALQGDGDAIKYLIGKGFSTDPTFLNTLATMENAGKNLDENLKEGLLNNIHYVKDGATGVVTGIKNAVTGETYNITPTLLKNLEDMGVKMGDALGGKYQYVYDETTGVLKAIVDSATKEKVWVNTEMEKVGEDAAAGFEEGVNKRTRKAGTGAFGMLGEWVSGILEDVRGALDSHSPSREFIKIGEDASEGFSIGFGSSSFSSKLSESWENARTWWQNKKAMSTYTPSIGSIKDKVVSAWNTAKSWYDSKKSGLKQYTPTIGSIYEKLKERWDNARTWYNSKKSKLNEYTPAIGSIYEKVSARWKNARDWYNKKKSGMSTYTPSIGSIKDKLVSAWNTAKTWWNKNVKLSIPSLSFKVSYTNKGLNTAQKAVVKALGMSGWPSLKFAAAGGMFDQGSLVWAGERGPEVVANASGGRTGVMNVQQMQDAVYEGVYAAVMAAQRAANGGANNTQAVNVYLDGRQITAAVEQRQHERGASIMGNPVFSY